MRETEVMLYNKQFMIMIIKGLRKGISEHGYVLKLFLFWNNKIENVNVRVKNLWWKNALNNYAAHQDNFIALYVWEIRSKKIS